jgi:mono/diheme cytochrome c family protein
VRLWTALAIAALVAVAAATFSVNSHASPSAANPKRGKVLFVAMCGSCHTLAAAGTHGKTGGNLAEEDRSMGEVVARIKQGGEGMPSFATTLRAGQIRDIAAFVAAVTPGRGGEDD